jgi:hypothetical protein
MMITPVLVLDSQERWKPCSVDTIPQVNATVNGQPVDLAHLPPAGGKIDFPKDMKQPDVALQGYHRCAYGGGLWWHQFWTWWLYNPKKYAGFGEHEGDWEMVQLGCIDEEGDYPVLMTCSQHGGGEKREYWRVELTEGLPKVYVARDSHANYFEIHYDVTDQVDGQGDRIELEWLEFSTWAEWPGKWGNSENSPGQLSTRRAWQAPHAWHGQARG